jgi:nucleoid-associated protein YgaU
MHGHARPGVLAIVVALLALLLPTTRPAAAAPAAPRPAVAPATTAAAPRPAARVAAAAPARARAYLVRPSDTLSRIAERYLGDPARWREIHARNRNLLRSPDLIRPGDRLRLPPDAIGLPQAPPERTYTVARGDSLWRIAGAELGDPGRWPELYRANRGLIRSPDLLRPGWTLQLPPGGGGV